jgi:hypothetical protein
VAWLLTLRVAEPTARERSRAPLSAWVFLGSLMTPRYSIRSAVSFIDALRLADVPGEINIALVGHTDPSVNGKYGAKDKAIRFRHRLAEAVASVTYAGLDLSHLMNQQATKGRQGAHTPPRC